MEPLLGVRRTPTEDLIKSIEDVGRFDSANMAWYSPVHSLLVHLLYCLQCHLCELEDKLTSCYRNSESPLSVCQQVRQDISLLDLSEDETAIVIRDWTPISLKVFIEETKKSLEREKGNKVYEVARKLVFGAAEFSDQFVSILQLVVPCDSEYAIALGLLAFMLKVRITMGFICA